MSIPNVQLFTIVGLAAGLGATLTMALQAKTAVGYPAGASVSAGSNPVVSAGGHFDGPGLASPLSATADQALIITDVILSASDVDTDCLASTSVTITDGTSVLAQFSVGVSFDSRSYDNWSPQLNAQLGSGIRIAPGRTMEIQATERYQRYCNDGGLDIDWTVSGYYAQP